jgi:hemolysin activation/secretion protein
MATVFNKPFKSLTLVISALFISSSVMADSSQITDKDIEQAQNPKQCLKELQSSPQATEPTPNEDKQQNAKEPSWLDKLLKQHKLGSLHFQDLIELFH